MGLAFHRLRHEQAQKTAKAGAEQAAKRRSAQKKTNRKKGE